MAGRGKDDIQFKKQDVPKFIRDFKARTNQKDSPDINSKCNTQQLDESAKDKHFTDEAPIISLADGVNTAEAKEFVKSTYGTELTVDKSNLKRGHSDDDDDADNSKVLYKKPAKVEKKKKKSNMKKVHNKKLLSFGEEDDQEEET